MIPGSYRFQVENAGLGTSVDVEVKVRGFDMSDGTPTYGAWTGDLGTAGLASGSFHATAAQDNTADGFTHLELEVVLSGFGGTPNDDGQVEVYFQGEGDASSDWPDDGNGARVLIFDPDTTGTYRKTTVV